MKKWSFIALAIFCIAPSIHAETGAVLNKPLPLEIGGRVKTDTSSDGLVSYTYSWPGVYFVGQFTGTEVEARFNDDQNYLALIVDDNAPIIFKNPGKLTYLVKDLKAGHHQIRLEKTTETQSSQGHFDGFFVGNNAQAEAAEPPKRRIEFVGDSHTVGYANTSTTRDCSWEQVFSTTNTSLAFGPVVAKHFNAAYQINASSGFGVVRNYNGTSPDKSLLSLYPYTLNDAGEMAKGDWRPQVIVIGLGTNDFSTALNAGEHWKTRDELHEDYISHYIEFIAQQHKQNPSAYLMLLSSEALNGEFTQQVEKVATQVQKDKSIKLATLIYKGLDFSSCHWHPSVKDDQAIAKIIIDKIEQQKGIW
jgi:lysophospholipase L1-like esterase